MAKALISPSEFVEFVRTFRQAVVATVSPDGAPEAALVEMAVTPAGDLVFDTKTEARKVGNLAQDARVAIVVGWGGRVSIQVEGDAELLTGAEREELAALYSEQFPQRPPVNDLFALYRVRPGWLRYCEATPIGPPIVVEGRWS
jgi:hypothetical protein